MSGLRSDPTPRPVTEVPIGTEEAWTHRVLHAGAWNFLLRSLVRGAGFIRNVIFARLLAPSDIGLFGIALVILSIIDRFSQSGLQAALVQKRGAVEDYLDTV